ncbi:2-Hydroxyacid oxidase 1-like [Dermacentor andersoni]|uniref:2-Hydroxyacid oxidase 1-like n=1 Tax=Dermacentor andersoni TaxID=34620 RepID=UPI003B3A51F6
MNTHSDSTTSANDIVVTIDDIERLAHTKLPPKVNTFYQDGADQQQTVSENLLAFKRLRLLPRVLRNVTAIDTEVMLLGQRVSMPVGISPTALQKLAHPDGEAATARAAANAGTVMILSALSTTSMEDVASRAPGSVRWLQMEVVKDRSVTVDFLSRAEKLGYGAIVLTVDMPVFGLRVASVKNRMTYPEHLCLANFEGTNYGHMKDLKESCLEELRQSFDRSLTWDVLTWIRSITKLPLVVKGILTAEDACEAVNHGVSAILVSNHGGRQLDGVPATIEALASIVRAVRGRCEVYMDGGVRKGTDVVKALALGARAVFIGRPVIWGLAYDGENGVNKVLSIYSTELERALALMGKWSLLSYVKYFRF